MYADYDSHNYERRPIMSLEMGHFISIMFISPGSTLHRTTQLKVTPWKNVDARHAMITALHEAQTQTREGFIQRVNQSMKDYNWGSSLVHSWL